MFSNKLLNGIFFSDQPDIEFGWLREPDPFGLLRLGLQTIRSMKKGTGSFYISSHFLCRIRDEKCSDPVPG
jgi:hypothetical protein